MNSNELFLEFLHVPFIHVYNRYMLCAVKPPPVRLWDEVN